MSGDLSQSEIDALLNKDSGGKASGKDAAGSQEEKINHEAENDQETTSSKKRSKPLVEKVEFSPLKQRGKVYGAKPRFHYFDDIELVISGELGTAEITVRDLLKLKEGSVLKLDKMAGESSTILANEQFLGYAEIVVINDRFGLRVTAIGQEELKGTLSESQDDTITEKPSDREEAEKADETRTQEGE